MLKKEQSHVAYFVMELALVNNIPNYAGGLGVLAADTLYSCADMGVNAVGVSLIYHVNDYSAYAFNPEQYMTLLDKTVTIQIEGRDVKILIWQMDIISKVGHTVPILFLSSNTPENEKWDRDLTKYLYASDQYGRLGQEAILGVGGVKALDELGYNISNYHLNEGHAALATLELLKKYDYNEDKVRSMCNLTTHTPIPAGHDYFDYEFSHKMQGDIIPWNIQDLASKEKLGMTQLAMNLSKATNSVSLRHQEVCKEMFPGKEILNVTNGIYHSRWVGKSIRKMLNTYIPDWEKNPEKLIDVPTLVPDSAILEAHNAQEDDLIEWVNKHSGFFNWSNLTPADKLESGILTIGFARRFVPYKRPDLIFKKLERLAEIGDGKIQIIFANRCHPDDHFCNDLRDSIKKHADALRGKIRVVIIPDYDLHIAEKLVVGSDIWLNTPVAPREASGTSGMKASLNGGLNLSVADGWWLEGFKREPLSGWSFGGEEAKCENHAEQDEKDACDLIDALENAVDCYYNHPDEWARRMKHAIALIAYFNTHRLVDEYQKNIWNL